MTLLNISAGPYNFKALMETEKAPETCRVFEELLPFKNKIIQARWSGESAWIPLGDLDLDLSYENQTAFPSKGEILLYPGGISETEILFPYGSTSFNCKSGQLTGNHFLTITEGFENLKALGELVLWQGAQDIIFEKA
ncbi:DUF3830 family protein [candidate division KSB1 bacterium]